MEEEKTREFPEPEGSGTKQYLEEMQRILLYGRQRTRTETGT